MYGLTSVTPGSRGATFAAVRDLQSGLQFHDREQAGYKPEFDSVTNSPPATVSGRAIPFQDMGATPNAVLAGYQLLAPGSANEATVGIINLVPANANSTDGRLTGTLWQADGGASQ